MNLKNTFLHIIRTRKWPSFISQTYDLSMDVKMLEDVICRVKEMTRKCETSFSGVRCYYENGETCLTFALTLTKKMHSFDAIGEGTWSLLEFSNSISTLSNKLIFFFGGSNKLIIFLQRLWNTTWKIEKIPFEIIGGSLIIGSITLISYYNYKLWKGPKQK